MKNPRFETLSILIHPSAAWLLVLALASGGLLSANPAKEDSPTAWQRAGLSAEEAATHLLDRFSFGARPGEVERVAEMGPDLWLERQLAAQLPEPDLGQVLAPLESLKLSASEILATYQTPGQILRQAQKEGSLPPELKEKMAQEGDSTDQDAEKNRRQMQRALTALGRERGIRPLKQLVGELLSQKLYRALHTENQLSEVMTHFWFNHFYVSMLDTRARPLILPYERDAIRPHALGNFRQMLEASARHPAMLLYLDNFNSTAAAGTRTTYDYAMDRLRRTGGRRPVGLPPGGQGGRRWLDSLAKDHRPHGLNENYARELLELHTLGVDGGYTQDDVIGVARAFTGWTTLRPAASRKSAQRRRKQALAANVGFLFEGDFIFRATTHDANAKQILGHRFPAGRGVEDGREVLDLLANHAATAHHIAHKLAVRFVSDQPAPELVDRLAEVFLTHRGEIEEIIRELANSDEFWAAHNRGAKIKSPFELASSALRALDARVVRPEATLRWISRMGQPLYAYKAPTGYPDSADAWVNSGALLSRMNFALDLAAGRIEGVDFDLAALTGGREPASRTAALETYVRLLLPSAGHAETIALLTPVVEEHELADKVAAAGPANEEGEFTMRLRYYGEVQFDATAEELQEEGYLSRRWRRNPRRGPVRPPTALEQVVGVILGSPPFQRR